MKDEDLQHLNFFIERAKKLKDSYPSFSVDELIAVRMMFEVTKTLELLFEKKMSKHGLLAASWPILMMIYSAKNKCLTATDICCTLIQNKSTISRVIETLIEKQFLTRVTDANDRRKIVLQLTDAGSKLVEKALPESVKVHKQLFKDVDLDAFGKQMFQIWLNVQKIK